MSEKKWATGQSCIRKRSTTCKIGTLVTILKTLVTNACEIRPFNLRSDICFENSKFVSNPKNSVSDNPDFFQGGNLKKSWVS